LSRRAGAAAAGGGSHDLSASCALATGTRRLLRRQAGRSPPAHAPPRPGCLSTQSPLISLSLPDRRRAPLSAPASPYKTGPCHAEHITTNSSKPDHTAVVTMARACVLVVAALVAVCVAAASVVAQPPGQRPRPQGWYHVINPGKFKRVIYTSCRLPNGRTHTCTVTCPRCPDSCIVLCPSCKTSCCTCIELSLINN
jgi:hypothetical protein